MTGLAVDSAGRRQEPADLGDGPVAGYNLLLRTCEREGIDSSTKITIGS